MAEVQEQFPIKELIHKNKAGTWRCEVCGLGFTDPGGALKTRAHVRKFHHRWIKPEPPEEEVK